MKFRAMFLFAAFLASICASTQAQVSITTESYDNSRTAANLNETVLNKSNVNVNQFGKLFSYPVDGSIYAQPLYVPNVMINGQSHNVVYVATMNDVIYAFDADSNAGANAAPLWSVDFRSVAAGIGPVVSPTGNINGNVGIESTPVIDLTSNTIYLVSYTAEKGGDIYRLHALDIASGAEKFGGPVAINAIVSGSGYGSVNGTLTFTASLQNQRAGLALANGMVLIAWASFGDEGNFHGWLMSYNAQTLQQVSALCTTPNGMDGGIWMSGRAPVVDSNNNAIYMVANGDYDGVHDFGDSFVKYASGNSGLSVADWFTPDNFSTLAANDEDLGSSGPLLIPGTSLLASGGKQGILYVVDSSNMGHEWAGNSQIVQSFANGNGIFGGPAFYNRSTSLGPWLYIWASDGYLNAYHFNGSSLDLTPVSQSVVQGTTTYGSALAISANGSTPGTGIVWTSTPTSPGSFGEGTIAGELHAFDADNLATELWNSNMNSSRDGVTSWVKFRSPLVADGKLYMGSFTTNSTSASLSVYGLLSGAPAPSPGTAPAQTPPPTTLTTPPSVTTSSASFLATNTTTQGNWQSAYGADGYSIANSSQQIPAYATFSVQNEYIWTWGSSTTDMRGLQVPAGGRTATTWYATSQFQLVLNFTDGQIHPFTLYAVDWDKLGRSETIQILDAATGTVLDTERIGNFSSGVYLSWSISGSVIVTVATTSWTNAVVSGVFFGAVPSAGTGGATSGNMSGNPGGTTSSNANGVTNTPTGPNAAVTQFISADTATQGAWVNKYGTNGYALTGLSPNVPSYASLNVQSSYSWTWAASTTDPRALELPGGSGRIAETWYGVSYNRAPAFSFNLDFTDGNSHQFELYAVDFDNRGRAETIRIIDANSNADLDTRNISNFTSGIYLMWNISGNVIVSVTNTAGPNAVVSGVFFDSIVTTPPAAPPTWLPQIVLNWTAIKGANSYNLYRGTQTGGPYSLIGSLSATTYTDSNVMAGTTYFYVITAVNGIGESPKSSELASTAPKP
jgi:hypothetical protein